MKKALLILICLATSMATSMSLMAQEVTIPLMPGWTWISYPSTETVDFATAFGTFSPMEGDMIQSQFAIAEYDDGEWFGDFEQFYPGYGYMYYSNRTMPVFLTFNVQQPAPQVVVTTSEPMLITAISAMGGGEVTVSDGTYIIVKGLCWATHENPTTNDDFYEEAESGVGSFSLSMTGLNISTTYYVRAYAVTANGTVYGDQKTFTTRDGIPTLTTANVTNITGITATCGGNITDNGGLNITARGVCWSTTPNPTVANSHTTNGSSLGSFSSNITGLSVNTSYYVRAYATTTAGTAYGEEKTFTTRDGIPTLTTDDVTNITGITATCGGNVSDNGGLNITARGVCWSTTPNPTVANSHTTNGSSLGSFSSNITGLNVSTSYYVRAYATTAAGTAYGEEKAFTTRDGIPTLTTAEVTNIQGRYAYCGGNITDNCGLNVTARGVCWSTSPNPTVADLHTTNGSGSGSFTSYITGLSWGICYYVCAYATTDAGTGYGEQRTFTTGDGSGNYNYVDLGLPSGTLWATFNVGAETPEDYGDFFAWGETTPKNNYDWSTYLYCNGSGTTLTKYCNNSNYGYNGFTDNLTTLLPEDDAARANWGSNWRMPTKEEWQELYNNTTCTWSTQNGVNGRLFTASNGNSLFLPAAGYRSDISLYNAGYDGYYWSSSLHTGANPGFAWRLTFGSDSFSIGSEGKRYYGRSVRAVRSSAQITNYTITVSCSPSSGGTMSGGGDFQEGQSCTVAAMANSGYTFANWTENDEVVSTEAIYTFTVTGNRNLVANFVVSSGGNHGYVDLGLPSGTLWATCNVGADVPEDYGNYFAWGETEPKDTYNWSTYQYCMGSSSTLTKYCNNSNYGYNGFTDNLTTLLPEDDAATVNKGSGWRMPTSDDWRELLNNTTSTWTTRNGVNGRLFAASNGNSLFLPAAGNHWDDELNSAGGSGYYWSSSLCTDRPYNAWYFYFYSGNAYMRKDYYGRGYGFLVRPVREN